MNTLHQTNEIVMTRPTQPLAEVPDEIPIIEGPNLKSGTQIIAGFMPAVALFPDRFEIPYFDPRTNHGYQRQPHDARVNQLASDLRRDRVDLPTAILLNLRGKDALEAVTDGHLDLDRLASGRGGPVKFYVVDGQHRILALKKLIEERADLWGDFMVPFVCMLGASEDEEMRQFHIVNSTAKSVRTDLALQLLRKRAEKDATVMEALQERGRDWQVDGQKIVERLTQESPIWQGRIRLANMDKGQTTIPSASMVSSLKGLLQSPFFGSLKQDHQIKILEAFWKGVRDVLRPVFDDPREHALQKGVGVMVMHTVLPLVLEIIRQKGWSVVEPDSYSRILSEPLTKLEGEDGEGNPVTGPVFWGAAPVGAAGAYSSSAGRRLLVAKIRILLPSVDPQ